MKAEDKKEQFERPQATGGLSLGEYTAICCAGVLDFEECLKLVKVRGEAMQAATELAPQCMCSVAGLDRPTLEKLCKEAKAKDEKAKTPVIKAGGAFHTPMMQAAQDDLNKAIEKALPKMKPPRCAIYFNVTGKKVSAGTNPADFVDLMKKQLTNEVLWEPCIKQMIMDQVKDFYEVGP